MSTWMPWNIAKKELKVIRRKKSVIAYVVVLPFLLAIGFSFLVQSDVVGASASQASLGLASLTYFFVILAVVLPTSIAAYSIVGEKVEKSLEPLLSTPTTDGELLLGKAIAALLPAVLAVWAGGLVFMAAIDQLMLGTLAYYYFPGWVPGIMLFLLAPLAAILGVEVAVILSSRVTDVRGANQLAGLVWAPFMSVFLAGVEGIISFDVADLLSIGVILLVIDIALSFLSRATFNREEILTKWR
jgi:ABC-2 type transport system permease protein